MSWDLRLLVDEDLRPYLEEGEEASFDDRIRAMIAQQKATWPMLRMAVDGLASVETRDFIVAGSRVTGQFNPARIVSTSAKVDPASIGKRPCFLCLENLPSEERGLRFDDGLVALCNPFPVLGDHLVITSNVHTPQAIEGQIGSLLGLAKALGPDWFCLYNGPRCGASAPDHLHYQAASAQRLPVFDDLVDRERSNRSTIAGVERFALRDYRINLAVARSKSLDALSDWFEAKIDDLKKVTGENAEPMINLVVRYADEIWTVIIYPRGKHRPDCYFAEGDAKLTVSPAAIDLSGLLVIPERRHFDRITEGDISGIFRQVTLDDERFQKWLSNEGRD